MVLTLQPYFESKQLNRIRQDNTVVTLNPSQLYIFMKFDLKTLILRPFQLQQK